MKQWRKLSSQDCLLYFAYRAEMLGYKMTLELEWFVCQGHTHHLDQTCWSHFTMVYMNRLNSPRVTISHRTTPNDHLVRLRKRKYQWWRCLKWFRGPEWQLANRQNAKQWISHFDSLCARQLALFFWNTRKQLTGMVPQWSGMIPSRSISVPASTLRCPSISFQLRREVWLGICGRGVLIRGENPWLILDLASKKVIFRIFVSITPKRQKYTALYREGNTYLRSIIKPLTHLLWLYWLLSRLPLTSIATECVPWGKTIRSLNIVLQVHPANWCFGGLADTDD